MKKSLLMFSVLSFRTSLPFHEQRLLFFAKEKPDIPIPYLHEVFTNALEILRSERDAFRKKYRQSIEAIRPEPAITSDVLLCIPDDEAGRVFEALNQEGNGNEDVRLLRTRRSTQRGLARFQQRIHEQVFLLNAVKDVRKIQSLLYDYMREQTALENLNDRPDQRKANKIEAFALLEIVSNIGNGDCRFPPKEEKRDEEITEWEKEEAEEERKKLVQARKNFRYHCIRDSETLRDEEGNLVLSMPLMRSLAALHLSFNHLDVDSAMDASSITLAEHSGEDLLALARGALEPAQCKPLSILSRELHAKKEPAAKDFQEYPVLIEPLPALPRLILTLLYKDIQAAHPREPANKLYGREDLLKQYREGGDIITDEERAVLMRELIEYLADYSEAITEAEENKGEKDGFTVRNALRIYTLLRENARKYLFQSGVNYICLTGSDHGAKHLIQGDVRFTTQIAEKLNWSARDRVCLRQIAVDHDLGYTHTGLQLFSMHEKGIPLNNGYYGLTKDHPLYSSAYFEVHRPMYEEYFGKQGSQIIGHSILDHSEVKGHLREEDAAKRVQALFCRIDCLAVSADLKSAPAFMHDKVLVAMSKAFEAAEYLKNIDARMEKLWKESKVRSDEYQWLSTAQQSLRTIAGEVKQYLLGLKEEIYSERVFQQAYHYAIDQHYDPFNPKFPVQRDFGSNAIEFAGIDVRSTRERDHLKARFSIRPLLFSIAEYFGKDEGARFATSAIIKLFEDFGGAIPDPSKLVNTLKVLSTMPDTLHDDKIIVKNAEGGVEYEQQHETHVHFVFEIPADDPNFELTDRMRALMPSLIMMRELLRLDFDHEALKEMLKTMARLTKNNAISASVEKGDLRLATVQFFEGHFSLSK